VAVKVERNLAYGLGEIRRIVARLGLAQSIRDQACSLFRTAQSEQLCRGRSLEAVAAASVYATTRCNGPRTITAEVAACAHCDQSRLTNAYTAMNVELELPTQPIAAINRIPRIATELEVPDQVRRRALELHRRHVNTDDDRPPAEWRRSRLSLSRCPASRILSRNSEPPISQEHHRTRSAIGETTLSRLKPKPDRRNPDETLVTQLVAQFSFRNSGENRLMIR